MSPKKYPDVICFPLDLAVEGRRQAARQVVDV